MLFKTLIFVLLLVAASVGALHLPSYIKPCKADANLNACAIKNGNEAIPHLVKGDRKHKIPNLLPLILSEVNVDSGESLQMQLKNVKVYGLENAKLEDVQLDLQNLKASFKMRIPLITIISDYTINGKILILPITGNGNANFTFVDGDYTYYQQLKMIKKDGVDYVDVTDSNFKLDFRRDYFHFDNLFNGNKILGDEVNRFVDENWKEVFDDVSPAVIEAVQSIIKSITKEIYKDVPLNELLLM